MASAIINHPYLHHPSSSSSSSLSTTIIRKRPVYASLYTSRPSFSKTPTVGPSTWVRHMYLTPFFSWNGLKKNGISISRRSSKSEKRKKFKGKGVFASLFGVGAPEALVIGVMALLVFGPKGLAEVAKNLGKTLRSFQPTIRELQEVSREFKSTLEKEIGLDELKNPVQGSYTSNTVKPSTSQVPPDTLQNSELTIPSSTTTDDSQATTSTPAGSPDDLQATATTSALSQDVSQETAATPATTNEDSQPTDETANGPASDNAYSSEELLTITEEQLKASASQQQKEQLPFLTPSENSKSEI